VPNDDDDDDDDDDVGISTASFFILSELFMFVSCILGEM
jgi:hypothetical protein